MEKNIVLGITGGIAVYKMVEVASRLTKENFEVYVIMTEAATKFVSPLTLQAITHNPVETDLFTPPQTYDVKHISLADRADLVLIAPATANFIGKMARGIADDLLSTIILATGAPVMVAPAMNKNMYNNPIVQDNLNYLKEKGFTIINPASGYLACGEQGQGRLPEPPVLVEHIEKQLTSDDFEGKKILITAGPTREPLDPVRFISNYSSGKMGYALARAASFRGANVNLISGPTDLPPPLGVNIVRVETGLEMEKEVNKVASDCDIIIMVAAVADFRPEARKNKIKKTGQESLQITLNSNPDILAKRGANKSEDQLLVGFAAESQQLEDNALKKMERKKLDMIIANKINVSGTGFNSDHNQVTIYTPNMKEQIPKMNKRALADVLLDKIYNLD
ncbi:MAG: bifunctional phosphopantothenoylcysteine decarboxylase/phosphopantothenate--cysteine ligase CoaBC [Halanaerobiales bacterium]|nr:bifunctional phosphopantothenoylcysteine decarboxylase/phosphopantothenate--cysteine ligase CoaBC [Halanaerobiales bacterium]